jgi:hypothetical protein
MHLNGSDVNERTAWEGGGGEMCFLRAVKGYRMANYK